MEQVRHSFSECVLRDMSSAVLVLDKKGNIVYTNGPADRFFELEGIDRAESIHFPLLKENDYNDSFNETVFEALYHKDKTTFEKVPYEAPSGKKYVFFMSCSYLEEQEAEDSKLVITLKDETEAEEVKRKLNDSSLTFTTFLFGFCGWILAFGLWEFLGRPFSPDYMTNGVELLGIIMLIFSLARTSLTWREIGIVTDKPGLTVLTGLILSAVGIALLCVVKFIVILINPDAFSPDEAFFDFSRFGMRQVLYIVTAGVQEFLARSVMQSNLRRFIIGKHKGTLAIVLSSLLFAGLHIHLGFIFMIGAAVLGGLEGVIYEKHQNFFGVWIVHYFLGVSATLLGLVSH